MKNKLRSALLKNQLTLGGWIQIGHPAIAEILARAGFDWICVDLEHGAIDIETMTDIFRTVDAFDCVPVARIPRNDPVWIKRSLDSGAGGLIIPNVNSVEEAEQAVQEAKYPPRGRRSFGYSRANSHGRDFNEYIKFVNDEIALIMQIEHKDGIANLDDILEVPDIDGLFIGPLDLSGSYGRTGELDSPEMIDALERYRTACRQHSMAAGIHLVRPNPASIKKTVHEGYTLVALGLDNVFLDEGAAAALKAAGR